MRILVVGGAGYVGSHTTRMLLESGHEIWVYDNLSLGHRRAVPPDRLIIGELNDRERLVDVLRGHAIDAVMHFAAFTLVGESVSEPARYYRNNFVGSLELLDAMREAQVWRIVFSSTAAIYGSPAEVPIVESAAKQPINPYGVTKLAVEQCLDAYAQAYQFGSAALRYFNAAGASPVGDIGEDHSPESHLIPIVLQVALGQREAIDVYGSDYPTPDGTCIRDYIHVDDLATAHITALEQLRPSTAIQLNLGTGRGASVREVIDACRRVTGHEIPERSRPRRAGDPAVLVADTTAARSRLRWEPQYADIQSIVETAWRWHHAHPHGYGDHRDAS